MFFRLAALAVLFVTPFHAQAPAKTAPAVPTLPDGRGIVDRHVKEVGGRDAILAHKSLHVKGTLSVPASGITGPIEIFGAANPDRVIVKTSVPGIGDIMEGFDGSHAWIVSPMTGPMLKIGKELQQTKFDADFYGELRDPKKYTSVKTVEKTACPETSGSTAKPAEPRTCYKVALSRIDGSEDVDFYDVASGLRAGSINTRETSMGTMTVTSAVGGYKKFGNMLVATSQSQKVMGVEQTITLSAVEFDKVEPSVFDPPAAIKALIK
jgi:hypothetical protein